MKFRYFFPRNHICAVAVYGKCRIKDWQLVLKHKSEFRVLVVEDEAMIGMMIEDMLFEIGCKIVEATTSVEGALDFLAVGSPDFAILDINLNGARSDPVASELKSRGVPFVFVSGYDGRALDPAFSGTRILQKPFYIGDLSAAVDEAYANREIARSAV